MKHYLGSGLLAGRLKLEDETWWGREGEVGRSRDESAPGQTELGAELQEWDHHHSGLLAGARGNESINCRRRVGAWAEPAGSIASLPLWGSTAARDGNGGGPTLCELLGEYALRRLKQKLRSPRTPPPP